MSELNLNGPLAAETPDALPLPAEHEQASASAAEEDAPAAKLNGDAVAISEAVAGEAVNGESLNPPDTPERFAKAGRKGALRVHELIGKGLLYEKEHGLKRGRQRLRQLIEQGKLYEREHGLTGPKVRKRATRLSSEKATAAFLDALLRLVKPSVRSHLARVLASLEVRN